MFPSAYIIKKSQLEIFLFLRWLSAANGQYFFPLTVFFPAESSFEKKRFMFASSKNVRWGAWCRGPPMWHSSSLLLAGWVTAVFRVCKARRVTPAPCIHVLLWAPSEIMLRRWSVTVKHFTTENDDSNHQYECGNHQIVFRSMEILGLGSDFTWLSWISLLWN